MPFIWRHLTHTSLKVFSNIFIENLTSKRKILAHFYLLAIIIGRCTITSHIRYHYNVQIYLAGCACQINCTFYWHPITDIYCAMSHYLAALYGIRLLTYLETHFPLDLTYKSRIPVQFHVFSVIRNYCRAKLYIV